MSKLQTQSERDRSEILNAAMSEVGQELLMLKLKNTEDLTQEEAEKFQKEHLKDIREIIANLPIFAFAIPRGVINSTT